MAGRANGYRHDMTDDARDVPTGATSRRASEVLRRQRERHEPDALDADDEGVGALVNNTGLDGDAASG